MAFLFLFFEDNISNDFIQCLPNISGFTIEIPNTKSIGLSSIDSSLRKFKFSSVGLPPLEGFSCKKFF